MKKQRRKFILTIFSFVAIFMTTIATTFAWVGILTYANTESFAINLKTMELVSNYFLTISSTGKPGSFSNSIEPDELKKQILIEMGIDESRLTSSNIINQVYIDRTSSFNPVTTTVNTDNSFSDFKRIDFEASKRKYDFTTMKNVPVYVSGENNYIVFDMYISVDTKEGIGENTEVNAPVFLTELEDTLYGSISEHMVMDNNFVKFDYSESPYEDYLPCLPVLYSIPVNQRIKVDAMNSVRIGFEVYEPIDINTEYTDSNKIVANYIYYGGKLMPSIGTNGVYDLGGILPAEFNTALQELENTKNIDFIVPDEVLSRKELELEFDSSQIWKKATDLSSPNNYLGVHNQVQTKLKLRTYLWFEGWDSDCLLGIQYQNVTFNLVFTADHEERNE